MAQKSHEESSLGMLKRQLNQVISIKSEDECQKLKKSLKLEKKRLDRLCSQLQVTRQQIEFYTHEYQRALENIKDCNWRVTKDMCTELRKIPSPSKTIVEICEKIMLILDQPDKTFSAFKSLSKNFGYMKDLMSSVQGQTLPDNIINEILPVWKNQTIIQAKVAKISKCASLLAQWIGFIVEYSLKKETVVSSKRKEPEIDKKIRTQANVVDDLQREILLLEDSIKNMLEIQASNQEQKSDNEQEEELSEKFEVSKESSRPFGFTMHRGTASGGLLGSSLHCYRSQSFPNFSDEQLYGGVPVKETKEHQILYEGRNEALGCCRLKFFCF